MKELVEELIIKKAPIWNSINLSSTWGLADKIGGNVNIVSADVDLAALKKTFDFAFSAERERSYDQSVEKRYCTADVIGTINQSRVAAAITVRENTVIAPNDSDIARESLPTGVSFTGFNQQGAEGTLPSDATQSEQEAFGKAAFGLLQGNVRWGDPQQYTVQLTEKGETYVTIDE